MKKLGLTAAIAGGAIAMLALALTIPGGHEFWAWLLSAALLAVAAGAFVFASFGKRTERSAAPGALRSPSTDTARLLDNFEQRFAELKARKPSASILGDLYTLGTQLERRGRVLQAIAVFRHLTRVDGAYRDVAVRLKRLMDADRAATRPIPGPGAAPGLTAAVAARPAAVPVMAAAAPAAVAKPPAAKSAAAADADRDATQPPAQLGRYRLEREIGRGAMGVVYLGRDLAINRQVAIKAIPLATEFSETELAEARTRFFREAETAGRLNHPNIVTIYDVGEERGLAYIAMEYLKGQHLSEYAVSSRLLEPRKVVDLVKRTADALNFAHKQQVVHRDIKPANLMYDPATDTLKITDFGIARITDAGSTRTGIVLGTPSFMSPEQLEGRTVTGHSDLFSLGVSLFQLLTGHLPFTADSMTGLMHQIAEKPHPPLRAYRPDLPGCLEEIIDRALAKAPDGRFDTGAQMAAALEDCKMRIPSGAP
ncbi:MAG TPA: serine/threonine-protein kinase [Steroidobacteraceae bacterium]|nr:serine/threonine-protein kinase [Steroidobacteraceae bacterium]